MSRSLDCTVQEFVFLMGLGFRDGLQSTGVCISYGFRVEGLGLYCTIQEFVLLMGSGFRA